MNAAAGRRLAEEFTRTLPSTFAGIAPVSAPAFIAAQIIGGPVGTVLAIATCPARQPGIRADEPAPLAGRR